MKIKGFDQYTKQYSGDITTFINKVTIATSENIEFPYFNYVKSSFDLKESYGNSPIIISSDFAFESSAIYESNNFTYNLNEVPLLDSVFNDFKGESFIPAEVNDIKNIKNLKFPIKAYNKNGEHDFKTIGKLRASEGNYNKFRENATPRTRFTVLSFKDNPISIIETVNNFPLDVDINRFSYINEIKNISKLLFEKYNLDFYNIEILESEKGSLYLNGVNKKLALNPHQSFKVYEAAYLDYYETRIPNWVKKSMLEESVKPYYKNKAYDSMLIKSNHTLNYSKYL